MNTIDAILLGFVGLIAIFGFIRGMVSQAMAIVGLVVAYFFSGELSVHMVDQMAHALGSSQAYAKPFAVLWSAVLIYIGCRLIGFALEKILVDHSGSLKFLNRLGGGVLGAIKGCLILMMAFYILKLVPPKQLEVHAPKIVQSQLYQFLSHNSLMNPEYIETLVDPITKPAQEFLQPKSVTDPKDQKNLEKNESKMNNDALNNVLQKHVPKTLPKKNK